jgi:hypothetical protein
VVPPVTPPVTPPVVPPVTPPVTPPVSPLTTYYWACCSCVQGCDSYAFATFAEASANANAICDGAGVGLCYGPGTTPASGCGPCA